MVGFFVEHIIPAALILLPGIMRRPEAQAMLTAIGLQESQFLERHQRPEGPAKGFWQFERPGLREVLSNPETAAIAAAAIQELRYHEPAFTTLHGALEHNDVLACVCARLLLWTDPDIMPGPSDATAGWNIYLRRWRPGRPRPNAWAGNYAEAWRRVRMAQKEASCPMSV